MLTLGYERGFDRVCKTVLLLLSDLGFKVLVANISSSAETMPAGVSQCSTLSLFLYSLLYYCNNTKLDSYGQFADDTVLVLLRCEV